MSTLVGNPDWSPQQRRRIERLRKEMNGSLQREVLEVGKQVELGRTIMTGLTILDDYRHEMAQEDPTLHRLLIKVEAKTASALSRIQDRSVGWEV